MDLLVLESFWADHVEVIQTVENVATPFSFVLFYFAICDLRFAFYLLRISTPSSPSDFQGSWRRMYIPRHVSKLTTFPHVYHTGYSRRHKEE